MSKRIGLGLAMVFATAMGCSGENRTCEGACVESGGTAPVGGTGGSVSGAGGTGGTTGGAGGSGGSLGGGGAGGTASIGGTGGALGGSSNQGGSGGTPASGGAPGADAAPPGSPVYLNGKLSVVGKELHNEVGQVVQLKGVSSMWLNWEDDGYAESRAALQWMRDNWNVEIIRAAMGIEPEGAYLSDASRAKQQVDTIVQNAVALGLYVIIDWHDHTALDHQSQSEAFFDEVAGKYGDYPNVLYEVFNEPLDVEWSAIKPYHTAITAKIRAKDPDNVIILGTPNWSQFVTEAAADPVAGTNLMYTLHFYACSHGEWLREEAADALAQNLPLFVTEWGATDADGGLDGLVCEDDAQLWHDFMNQNHISWTSWKLDGCTDSSCLFKEGAPRDGGFGDEWLQGHGFFVRDRLKE